MFPSVMLFPFHSGLISGQLDAGMLIGTLQEHGAMAVETMHGLEETAPAAFGKLLEAIQAAGLPVACHDIGIDLIGDGETRQERLNAAMRQIDFAHDVLHAPTVLLYSSNVVPGMALDEGRRIYAKSLGTLSEYAASIGITATIEDFDPTPELACTAEHCLEILDAAGPKAKLTFDTGNFFAVGERSTEVFPRIKARIAHCHIKDVVLTPEGPRKMRMCVIGQGVADIRGCIALLRESGYGGFMSIEIAGRNLEDAVIGLNYLKTC